MSSIYSMQRPGFWRVPQPNNTHYEHSKKKVHFVDEYVHPNSPAERELLRGDIITKVEDYDARDLRHEDAQMLFRTQDNKIRLVVRRDNKIAMNSSKSNPISSLTPPDVQPSYIPPQAPYRAASPIPRGPHSMAAACASPLESLPHTVFPNDPHNYHHQQSYQNQQYQNQQQQQHQTQQHVNFPPPPPPRTCFSPQLTRDYYQTSEEENANLQYQPYRSTPLVLPGAKVYQNKNLPTESYLRHHPNPQMRANLSQEYAYVDNAMKQKVADSVLQRVVGPEEATVNGPKVVHKQFNSPIGLYSDSNIENTIKSTMSPLSPIAPASTGSSSVPSPNPNGTLNRQQLPTKIQGVFIDMSFLEQKKKILEQQQEMQRQKQQTKYTGYSPFPQFNRPN